MYAKSVPSAEFAQRRQRLMETMGQGAIALIPAAPERTRNRDTHYPYRQDSDFYYLSGFPEPEALMVLMPGSESPYTLFCRERDPLMETWNGRRAGVEGAVERFGADAAFPIKELEEKLPELLADRERVYYAMGYQPDFDVRVMEWLNKVRGKVRAGVRAPREFVSVDELIHEMRLRKSDAEIQVMSEAARISAEAHRRAMEVCRPGLTEYEIEAELLHTFRRHKAVPSYPAIVGGGANGCILHYVENASLLNDGDLLLIDAGAEVDLYAADITRTFPVNGRFSSEQRAVYELVLAAQQAAIDQVRPGRHWNDPHEAALRVLTEGMVELGLLRGEPAELMEKEEYKRFFMHRTGHWLGMDVHDVGNYKDGEQWRTLEPGMVMTVEPGLYIAAGAEGVDERWWNIGIRIEDDVLVTQQGHRVLTDAVPKAAAEVEALMGR